MTWDDETPRKLLSEDGYIMVASLPCFTKERGTVCKLSDMYDEAE
jgi:hypothetical protein